MNPSLFIKSGVTWMRNFLLRVPLRLKIMGLAFGLTMLFGTMITYKVSTVLHQNMVSFLKEESRSVAHELASQAPDYLLINDIFGLNQYVQNIMKNRQDIRYIVILDNHNRVLLHTFGTLFPEGLLKHFSQRLPSGNPVQRLLTDEGVIWEASVPIMQGAKGSIRVGVREVFLQRRISSFIHDLLIDTLLVAIAALLLSRLLTWLITRPFNVLLDGTQAIRRGDFQVSLDEFPQDEGGRLIEAFNAMAGELRKMEEIRSEKDALRRDFLQNVIAGQERERKRIARELHDQTGQSLASLRVGLKLLGKASRPEEVKEGIDQLQDTISAEMETLHNLAFELRPNLLDDMGLLPAIETYIADFPIRHGLEVSHTFIGFGENRPDSSIETCIYRIVQEALTNIVRHAHVGSANILLERRNRKIRLIVEDDGCGFNPDRMRGDGRLGIHGMRERAELLSGSLRVDTEPGQGTMIVVEIPEA